jgi:hypothetical protein
MNFESSLGLWEYCNLTKIDNKIINSTCSLNKFNPKEKIARNLYKFGFVFQLIGALLTGTMFLIGLINYKFAVNWNLYLIFCFTILTILFASFLLMIVSVVLIQSKPKIFSHLNEIQYYEVTNESKSFILFLINLGLCLIVFCLVNFVLTISFIDFVRKNKEIKTEKAESCSNYEIPKDKSTQKVEKKIKFFGFRRFFNRENSFDNEFAKTPMPIDIPKIAAPKTAPNLSLKAQAHLSKSRCKLNSPHRSLSFNNNKFTNS